MGVLKTKSGDHFKACLERFKHNSKNLRWIERDLARYWSNWCCKWLFWGERQVILHI